MYVLQNIVPMKKIFLFLQISDASRTNSLEEAYLLRCLPEGIMIAME